MLPEQFVQRMQNMLGEEYDLFEDSFSGKRHQALRLNPLKVNENGDTVDEWIASTKNVDDNGRDTYMGFHMRKVPWVKEGYYYESIDAPGKHPYHEAGMYYIQEPSAMAPVSILEVKPGDKVLDLCAAPGGKSTQIAAALGGEGLLISNEIHPARAKILSENIERMGVKNACVLNETPARLEERFPEYFDRILVDAPCSGEGMFRKNEIACEEWSLENVELCGDRQDEILDCAANMLRFGGRLVYSTCTFAPKENEGSISRFLERHSDFQIVPIDKEALGIPKVVCDGNGSCVEHAADGIEGTLRLWPHRIQGEGHYVAVLVKTGKMEEYETTAVGGLEKGLPSKDAAVMEFMNFCKESLKMLEGFSDENGKFLRFGDNLYFVPACLPAINGLKVMRPGLQVGTLKKNRFEPSHALALALSPKDAVHTWNFDSTENTANAYLNGQTFPAEGEKGWYLICVDGFSMGWGKLAGGVMKNHYPKGLRKM